MEQLLYPSIVSHMTCLVIILGYVVLRLSLHLISINSSIWASTAYACILCNCTVVLVNICQLGYCAV